MLIKFLVLFKNIYTENNNNNKKKKIEDISQIENWVLVTFGQEV
jgi:hypothetical protein